MKTNSFILLCLAIFLSSLSCSASAKFSKQNKPHTNKPQKGKSSFYDGMILRGESSYYGKKFHGRKTANGEIYDMYKLTAAHKELPFGTILEVKNLANSKTVKVRINDRGPFVKERILDVSYGAAQELGLLQSGTAQVEIKIIKLGKNLKK